MLGGWEKGDVSHSYRKSEDRPLGLGGLFTKSLIEDGAERLRLFLVRPPSFGGSALAVRMGEIWVYALKEAVYPGRILRWDSHSNTK